MPTNLQYAQVVQNYLNSLGNKMIAAAAAAAYIKTFELPGAADPVGSKSAGAVIFV